MPTVHLNHFSPYEKLYMRKPDYTSLRVFGCLCFPLTRPYTKHKLHFRSAKATFLGYSSSHKGYKALLPDGKVIITRDILFDEHTFPYQPTSPISKSPDSTSSSYLQHFLPSCPVSNNTTSSSIPANPLSSASTEQIPHISSPIDDPVHEHSINSPISSSVDSTLPSSEHHLPVTQPTLSTHPMTTRAKAGIFKPRAFTMTVSPHFMPKTASDALLYPVWKSVMQSEFLALLKNKTWTLTHLPPGKNLIGCTWIFKIKFHISGDIARHKARLVAQGFSQQPGFDFTETFSPVVKPTTIRVILSLAVSHAWNITHLDVNNAFLNGNLEEDIYMKQPPGFEQGDPHLVCKLTKVIYGLKQASRAWFFTIHSALVSLGFSQSRADASLFFRHKGDETAYLLLYVDDMLITGSSPSAIQLVISQLHSHFSLKDLGEVNLFLGMEVIKTAENGLHLSQSSYIKDLLKKAKMTGAKGCPTPMSSSCELSKNNGNPVSDSKLYRSIVGALQYATITRPDINFAVNKVSQYMSSPMDTHWRTVKRILRYLSGTLDYGIQIHKMNTVISAFSDSDWAADLDDRRSTSGICSYVGRNLVSWFVKKQGVVARSSTEAEYRSLAQATSEVTWLNSLLEELKVEKQAAPVIWVDNMSAVALASNPVLHARTKHIELDIHFVRDKVIGKEIELRHVPSADQIADIFTKPLSEQSFVKLRSRLGLISLASLGLRGDVEEVINEPSQNVNLAECVKDEMRACEKIEGCNAQHLDNAASKINATTKSVDHLNTWKDVAVKGLMKGQDQMYSVMIS